MAIITGDAGDNLLTGGSGNDTIDGQAGNDVLHGGGGQDSLLGGAGDDYLDGDTGADTMVGGLGNDSYVVDNALDSVIEAAGEGFDLVYSSLNYTLTAEVENLILIAGSAAVLGTGNALDNEIDGNEANNTLDGQAGNDVLIGGAGQDSLFGGAGNDYLEGDTGADTMVGGLGNDIYVVDNALDSVIEVAGEGVDTVYSAIDYTLSGQVDYLTLISGSAAVIGTGNALDNDIIGNQNNNILTGQAGNDYLDGGTGADTMTGGAGNDIYVVDSLLDTVIEASGEGFDIVSSTVDYTLGANVERLILVSGSAALLGTGNALDNQITGNENNNTLAGLDGNDKIDGGTGADTILGGMGDDILDGLAGNDNMQGGDDHDVLEGGDGNDLEDGGAGDDSLWGEAGADTLTGGAGDDTYRFEVGNGIDTVIDTALPGEGNRILFGAGIILSDLTFTQNSVARTLTIQVGASGTDKLLFTNFDPTGANGSLVVQTLQFADLSIHNLVDLLGSIPTGPTEGDDVLTGTSNNDVVNALGGNDVINAFGGNDLIDGGAGMDTMLGGAGDDTYVVDNSGDVVTENANEGTDLVQSSVTFTLGANVENLTLTGTGAINGTGNSLNNIFTSNSAANVFTGGAGDDLYNVSTGDTVVEQANEGTDLVQSDVTFTLGANVENLTLTGTGAINGTGNSLNNIFTSNSAANVFTGGAGDDLYNVSTGDTVVEQANEGTDTVQSDVTFTLGANVENLVLTGTGAINGTGNSLNNIFIGNSAANVFTGSAGDDLYNVSTGDTVVEQANEGTDTVQSDVTFTLGANVENLVLTGTGAINGTGNSLNNIFIGNSAANVLIGGAGDDLYNVSTGDTVVEQANEGTDTVQSDVTFTLGANVENLVLTGTGAINGTGNSLNNIFTSNSAANVFTGGAGDDLYNVSTGDTVVEQANEGTDTVQSDVTFTLGANVENLTLTGTGAIHGIGNSLNNVLTGNSAANVLIGGAGDDLYNVSTGDTAVEQANEGTDTVQSAVSFTLGANLENLVLTGTDAIDGTGNSLNNVLTGNSAANVLSGGAGADTLLGGAGDDTYGVDQAEDVVTEQANEGIDLVQSSVSYTLGANLENLVLTGTDAIDGTGNSLNNVLTGNSAANVLSGGAGADTLLGGAGDDTYGVDTLGDVVTEQANEGIDLVQSSVSYTLGANLENLVLTGTDAIDGTGNSLNNVLTGNSAANVLSGGAGADTLLGGAGDDTYGVDTLGDVVTEQANEGIDLVQSSVSYTLGANVENLVLTGTDAIDGTGNSLNNVLTGNSAANVLSGGAGADTLLGGAGDDTYGVDQAEDVVTEQANEGIDLVQSSVSFTLGANLENLVLTGTDAIDGTGNSLNNVLTGNSAANVLSGGAGADTLLGGAGNDTYGVDTLGDVVTEQANEGIDLVQSSVSFTLGANLENLVLTGTDAIDGTGNELNNVLTGNSAANVLSGGAGADTLLGGAGDDTYGVDTLGDVVTEQANEGIDLVQSSVSFTLGANLENLVLTGTDAIDGTGNSLNNVLTGNSAANVLSGGAGADTLLGGAGDDTYGVDQAEDVVTEQANEGIDLVQSSVSYTLGANLENLVLTGTDAIDGTGNSLNNVLTGNSAANVLSGGAGADTLLGGAGDDTYGVDTLGDVVTEQANEGIDLVQSSVSYTLGANLENLVLTGTDAIDGTGNSLNNVLTGNGAANVLSGGAGADTLLGGAGDDTYGVDTLGDVVTEQANEGIDLVQSSVSYTLGANVENLVLTGTDAIDGTGNSLNNVLTGNSAANVLSGGAGDDLYNVSTGDTVVEQANDGIDLVQSDVTWTLGANVENLTLTGTDAIDGTGNSLNNVLTGNSAANVLSGGAGADTLLGGAGNDTYGVDTLGDAVTEQANEGIDLVQSSVSYTLGVNLENLTLTGADAIDGTGNELNNVLTGNSAANVLTGGAGADTLLGGAGDDTYGVDTLGDVVTEQANDGIDLVQSDVTWTLGVNVENLMLTGTDAIEGTGNELNNVLTGNSSANVLTGGAGDDLYNVSTGDTVVEQANDGIDLVQSDVTWTLGANVENLTLTGTDAIDATGNSLNNTLIGNSAVNVLTGGAGVDTLLGGAGDDTYGVDQAGDVVTEQANEGIDTVQSSVSFTLGANVENLTLTGTDAIDGTGNSLNNVLTGNSAANVLTGGAGADTLLGGAGDDTYGVDTLGDVVTEQANEGIDTVRSSVSYTLGANLENLVLTGTDVINGTGNSLNNTLTGNSAANVLIGGAGDDLYNVSTGDTVVEQANDGIDLVQSDVTWTLGANVENLVLTGTDAIDGTGNELTNVLTGNSAANVLTGGAGIDTLLGGAGNDTYGVDTLGDVVTEQANEGIDTVQSSVSYTLGANLENLTLTGTDAINGTGNSLNNTLIGNSAANMLTGGAGADTLLGGAGDDTYGVDQAGDVVTEQANEGIDLVQSSASFTLGANVEKLTLTGTAAIDGTGNSLNNTLIGNSAANVLTGGAGDDIYTVGAGDTVVEAANEGTDIVLSGVSFTLGANVEKLTLTGTGAIDGTGNSLNNTLIGNSAANVLTGGAGDDIYTVGAGDTVVEAANEGTDIVLSGVSFTLGANVEKLTLTGTGAIDGTGNSLNNTLIGNSAANVLTGGAGSDIYTVGAGDTVVEAANEGTDIVLSGVSFTLGANVEKLTLTGTGAIDGTGNSLNNTLVGNSAANVLTGGAGNDIYTVGVGDTVVEAANEGTDLVLSDVTWTLGANVENLTLTGTGAINGTGNSLSNVLTGNSAANVLTGGAGHDIYVVGAGDTVVEAANEGTDLVQSAVSFTLGANVENLTLTGTGAINGTGNSLNNVLTGNSAANVLTGGAGHDIYVVGAGDTVVEAANEGTDLVQSAVSFTLGANVENLTLTGTGAINGTGNSLNNVLTGNSAANVLTGGAGHDIYVVGAGDTVVEAANEGTDLVQSSVSWTLGANLERLTLTGTGAIDGTGNSLSNVLTGNSAANVLAGGAGNDTLAGGLGNDTYRINRGEGQDTIAENDGTGGNSDVLLYGATINPFDVVLSRQVNDLRLAIHGSTDAVTIQNWYSAPATAQVETIQAGNGQTLQSTQVDQLIQAMASFSQQTGLTWDQALDQQPQQVQTVLAASWQ